MATTCPCFSLLATAPPVQLSRLTSMPSVRVSKQLRPAPPRVLARPPAWQSVLERDLRPQKLFPAMLGFLSVEKQTHIQHTTYIHTSIPILNMQYKIRHNSKTRNLWSLVLIPAHANPEVRAVDIGGRSGDAETDRRGCSLLSPKRLRTEERRTEGYEDVIVANLVT